MHLNTQCSRKWCLLGTDSTTTFYMTLCITKVKQDFAFRMHGWTVAARCQANGGNGTLHERKGGGYLFGPAGSGKAQERRPHKELGLEGQISLAVKVEFLVKSTSKGQDQKAHKVSCHSLQCMMWRKDALELWQKLQEASSQRQVLEFEQGSFVV